MTDQLPPTQPREPNYATNGEVAYAQIRALDALTALFGDLQLLVKKAIEVIDEERSGKPKP
jgi:hypothetical protein